MGKPSTDSRSHPSDPEAPPAAGGNDRLSCYCFRSLSFRCIFVLLLTAAAALSGFLWLPPFLGPRSNRSDGDSLAAPVQARFTLHKPVSFLSLYTARLEYDIFEEIGVPNTKISVISMHPLTSANSTRVIFGVFPDNGHAEIDSVSKSLLKSALVELMLQQSNLSLTESIFGRPSSFDILKFPGGISVIPLQAAPIWQITKYLFSFTLNSSITDVLKNLNELKGQLKIGLGLKSYENAFVQLMNFHGSTVNPPVTVHASILSDIGSRSLLPPRLKQLAEVISGSPQNLGLNHTLFGKVKEVVLSSYLNNSITFSEPPSPAPSPTDGSPHTALSPSEDAYPPVVPVPDDPSCPHNSIAPSRSQRSCAPSPHSQPKPPSPNPSKVSPILPFPSSPLHSPCVPSLPPVAPTVSPAPTINFRNPHKGDANNEYFASPSPASAPFSSSANSHLSIRLQTIILVLLLPLLWQLNAA